MRFKICQVKVKKATGKAKTWNSKTKRASGNIQGRGSWHRADRPERAYPGKQSRYYQIIGVWSRRVTPVDIDRYQAPRQYHRLKLFEELRSGKREDYRVEQTYQRKDGSLGGDGFVPPARWIELANQGQLGLVSASDRSRAIGGDLIVDSRPGEGTLVTVRVPRGHKRST
jgi:hypothetical protein